MICVLDKLVYIYFPEMWEKGGLKKYINKNNKLMHNLIKFGLKYFFF